jgi:hypothetical protein
LLTSETIIEWPTFCKEVLYIASVTRNSFWSNLANDDHIPFRNDKHVIIFKSACRIGTARCTGPFILTVGNAIDPPVITVTTSLFIAGWMANGHGCRYLLEGVDHYSTCHRIGKDGKKHASHWLK